MQLFYSSEITGDKIILDSIETRHAIAVLRKSVGDRLTVINGKGRRFEAEILRTSKKETELQVIDSIRYHKPAFQLHLAVAPTKNMDRMEWLLEKSIEIGLASITFLRCEHSERKQVNMERLEKIAVAACKQSLTWHFPKIYDIKPFANYVKQTEGAERFIAVCEGAEFILDKNTKLSETVYIMIGPEGDFSESEYTLAQEAGWKGLSLGEKRLRTETAALLSVADINFIWGA